MRSKPSASVQHASQPYHSLDRRLRWSHPLPHTHAHKHTHTQILCPSVLFYSLFYFSVFTFQLSRDTYYSYHPPFYINYHIVSPFISLLSLSFLQGQHAGRTAFFSSKTTFYQFAVLQHVPLSSLSGVIKPVRGTWRRLHWACRCISRGLCSILLSGAALPNPFSRDLWGESLCALVHYGISLHVWCKDREQTAHDLMCQLGKDTTDCIRCGMYILV